MQRPTVAAVINYCHLERAFLPHVLRECRHFADRIVVVGGDKYTDGQAQPPIDDAVMREFDGDVTFIRYEVDIEAARHDRPGLRNRNAYWCNTSRWLGCEATGDTDYVLFLDADEVPEGERFAAFVRTMPAGAAAADAPHLKLANWWYFRYPWLRSLAVEDSIVLVPRAWLTRDRVLCSDDERDSLVDPPRVRRRVVDDSRQPMFHHYSWVRTPADLYRKVRVWSHKDDLDWSAGLDRELAIPIDDRTGARYRDTMFGKTYVVVHPWRHFPLFTEDWFTGAAPGMLASCSSRRTQDSGAPRILEIGSWEGRSALWFMEHFPRGHLTCVDTFAGSADMPRTSLIDLQQRFRHNLRPHEQRLDVRVGRSREMLFGLQAESFDIIYVDGDHECSTVLTDAAMAWALLKPGGVLMFDDYDFREVRKAVDSLVECAGGQCEVLHSGYQLHLLKASCS